MISTPTIREPMRAAHRTLTSLLLVGAMLAPLVAAIAGWPVHTPLGVPLFVHVMVLVALGLVWFALSGGSDGMVRVRRWIGRVLMASAAATMFAAIVHERANVFYTERALVEGMAVLLILHVAASVLRARTRRPTTPAVWLGDVLTGVSGWLVLGAWVLIALEHRHAAGPVLLTAGVMQTLALLALVPDALAGARWNAAHSSARHD
jgi:hypothetical protein